MVEYIDVADMSFAEAEATISQFKTRHDVIAYQMQKEMGRRKADCNKQKDHPTQTLNVQGEDVEIDVDMVPIVKWLNSLPGVFTTFCCQGDTDSDNDGSHKRPYVLWYSNIPITTEYLIKKFTEFQWHSATLNCSHAYHTITTEVDFFMNGVRYSSKWYDNMALKDFIAWAGLA